MAKESEMAGRVYGKLTVIRHDGIRKSNSIWLCRCACGKSVSVRGSCLRIGNTTSCGCSRVVDEVGNIYGNLTVIALSEKKTAKGHRYWKCRCSLCGSECEFRGDSLRDGKVTACRCKTRKPSGYAAFAAILRGYKRHAAKRGLKFGLTDEQFKRLTCLPCHYCGKSPSNNQPGVNGGYVYNGVDRKENTVGYVTENCVACCGLCNRNKGKLSHEEFSSWIQSVYDHQYQMRPCPS